MDNMDDEDLEERYSEWKNEILKELRPFIVEKLEPHKLFTYLRSCQVLDCDDEEEIGAEKTRKRKTERLLDIIKNRGPEGFDSFCEAIRQNVTQIFILKKILDLFQKKKCFYESSADNSIDTNSDFVRTLPVPGGPGGPVVPYYEMPEENIEVAGYLREDRRPRSPPPAYSEQ